MSRLSLMAISQSKRMMAALIFSLAFASASFAQSFKAGIGRYHQGDLAGAESAFKAALQTKQAPRTRAKTLKFLGIVQFTLGNKNGAGASFTAALKLDPRLRLSSIEVLDECVVPFFNS